MKIAVIGAGFVGLTTAYELTKRGHEVVLIEESDKAGGLAVGFKPSGWDWSLETFYHHIFSNDNEIIDLGSEIGLPPVFRSPVTNSLINGRQLRLDSPASLLTFSELSIIDRLWMGLGLGILKVIPNGQFLERFTVNKALPLWVGPKGYKKVWESLLESKFGPFKNEVNLAWFWARVYKRTPDLGYFQGGFQALADKLVEKIVEGGGEVKLGEKVEKIDSKKFDRVVLTVPDPLVEKLTGIKREKKAINYLWGQTLILELDKSLMDGYWLNILEKDWPFLVVVEHTNFEDKDHYGNKTIVYLGNYLEKSDIRLGLSDDELLELYLPFVQKINSSFDKKSILRKWRFKAPFAQPVFPINYGSKILDPRLRIDEGLYIANMSMVYPWDRGTNYAVELGKKVANLIIQ